MFESNRSSWFLGVASLVLAALVVVLAIQNRQLKQQLASSGPQPPSIEAGTRFDAVELIDANQQTVSLGDALGGKRCLVVMFTPTCPACRATLPVWTELASLGEAPPILGINLAPAGSHPDEDRIHASLPFPVYHVETASSPDLARITHVPATILFDDDGSVERSWFGQLDPGWTAEMRGFLGG